MTGELRRQKIIEFIKNAHQPVCATALAEHFSVSRQVIVQDIALLRACNYNIMATNRGYLMERRPAHKRIFKVFHSDANTHEELETIVDCGGAVLDVFVNHKVYGVISAPLSIRSRLDIERLMNGIQTGKSTLLLYMTSGYHFHTVEAPSEEILDIIHTKLEEREFLAPVLDYEIHLLNRNA